jgi:hypothetical protein
MSCSFDITIVCGTCRQKTVYIHIEEGGGISVGKCGYCSQSHRLEIICRRHTGEIRPKSLPKEVHEGVHEIIPGPVKKPRLTRAEIQKAYRDRKRLAEAIISKNREGDKEK